VLDSPVAWFAIGRTDWDYTIQVDNEEAVHALF